MRHLRQQAGGRSGAVRVGYHLVTLCGAAPRTRLKHANDSDRNEILLSSLLLLVVYLVAAMFAAEGWVIYRLVMGRPVCRLARWSPAAGAVGDLDRSAD